MKRRLGKTTDFDKSAACRVKWQEPVVGSSAMPQIVLDLSEPLSDSLSRKAASYGLTVEKYLSRLAENDAARTEPSPNDLSFDEWLARYQDLKNYLATIPALNQVKTVDDSRESIYEGR